MGSCDILRSLAHRIWVVKRGKTWVHQAPTHRGVVQLLPAAEGLIGLAQDIRRAAHRLNATGNHHIAAARLDHARGDIDRLQPRRAKPIDGRARHAHGQSRKKRRHACDISVVLARLIRRTEVHIVDERAIDPSARHDRADRVRSEVVGTHRRKRAAVATNRRADCGNNGNSAGHGFDGNGNEPVGEMGMRSGTVPTIARPSTGAARLALEKVLHGRELGVDVLGADAVALEDRA